MSSLALRLALAPMPCASVYRTCSDTECSCNDTIAAPLIEQGTHSLFELLAESACVNPQMCEGFSFQKRGNFTPLCRATEFEEAAFLCAFPRLGSAFVGPFYGGTRRCRSQSPR